MKKKSVIVLSALLVAFSANCQNSFPEGLKNYVSEIHFGSIGNDKPEINYQEINSHLFRVLLNWDIKQPVSQGDFQVNIRPGFVPSFHWASHLTPTDSSIIAQHVFRAPAIIMGSADRLLSILPDLEILGKGQPVEWYLDMDAVNNVLTLGMSKSKLTNHVLYARSPGTIYPAGKIEFGFYIMIADDQETIFDPWLPILSFYWKHFGEPLYKTGQPLERKDLEPYVKHTYEWAFTSWKKSLWQEFTLGGKTLGGVAFIVNVTQSPDYPGEVNEREFRSVWNQAWFCSLRSASGLYRYARRSKDSLLKSYALKTKELALAFPQHNGFFNGLIATEMGKVEIDGASYNRSKGWGTAYFGNSDRNPYLDVPSNSPYHIPDMSFTATQMLDWYSELERDPRLLKYAMAYADALMKVQDERGFFPAWLSLDSLKPLDILSESPETSMSVSFLLKLYELTGNKKYLAPALKAMHTVMDNIILSGRWEDFETYYSCSGYGANRVGKKIVRNDQYKQNTLSIYWTAEALLDCFRATKDKKYLEFGRRVLDELLMYQAVWQPPYMYISTLGGFGVMNADGEWNDARQSLFAELIVKYGQVFNSREYIQRGLAALRASFTMMYCPENPKTKLQWEKRWTFFGPLDYGFMMENYGHGGITSPKGIGIGEFTIYDWGNGAASETYNRMLDHYGEKFLTDN